MKQGQRRGHPETEKTLRKTPERKKLWGVPPFQSQRWEETLLSPRWVSEKRQKEGEKDSQKVELLLLMDIICYKLRLRNCSQILNRLRGTLN